MTGNRESVPIAPPEAFEEDVVVINASEPSLCAAMPRLFPRRDALREFPRHEYSVALNVTCDHLLVE